MRRHCWYDILSHAGESGTSLCHGGSALALTLADGQEREMVAFLHHKAGHSVPVRIRVAPVRDQEGQIMGAVQIFSDDFASVEAHHRIGELEKMAFLD